MTWTKLDDSFYDNPKVVYVGNTVAGAFARSLSYCGRHNTDGKVPKPLALATLAEGKKATVQKLLEVGLWEEYSDFEYLIPDYLEFNPSAEKVAEERRRAAERQAKSRGKSR